MGVAGVMRILVVEDEWLISAMVAEALQAAGHVVVGPVTSVEAGQWLARQHYVDLALLDIDLGQGGSGVDLARSLHQRHGIPSLFASGSGHRARQASDVALGLLSKPYDARGVVMAVEAMGAILSGGTPARLPHGLEVFHAPVPAASV
jgi:DNA-binding response OmpR family regulator